MKYIKKTSLRFAILFVLSFGSLTAQKLIPFRLPDTGQNNSYTATKGEDSDFIINPLSFTDNGDGTVTDNITGLMWQKADGGEMTADSSVNYVKNLRLAGYSDWRLPTCVELFSINNYDNINPALNITAFTKTLAEYWWTGAARVDDNTKVWAVNAGGGIGAHPKSETLSAGGAKRFHVRGVRFAFTKTFNVTRFKDNGDGTISDNFTGLIWQKIQSGSTMTWEEALAYASALRLTGKSDWRVPNVKELQSLTDEKLAKPSFNKVFFTNILSGNYWSSTTLVQSQTKAWDINVDYGIVSYNEKTLKGNVLCVRGGFSTSYLNITDAKITGGEYEMGDHFGFVDPSHPSDELPLHKVKVNTFFEATTETTNDQFIAFLNSSLLAGTVVVKNNIVYASDKDTIYCYTSQYAPYYSISYDGKIFSIKDFRGNHPVVGVMWHGAAAFCNWLSIMNGLKECYSLKTFECDFTKNGYRLPTEAEWEYAARGGQINPYLNYPWGNDQDITKANWPESKDPYEGTVESAYPFTTPAAFYDGKLHQKSEYNWPSSMQSYQTASGANAFGLYDVAGNVWELINDWYGQNYYSISSYDNPKGPISGFIMPDGKPYRGMRGGNWYNGYKTTSVNDGHSRVSNRNPSYYRGPQDPNHPWYHVGFRIARNYDSTATGVSETSNMPADFKLYQNYPNPFNPATKIKYSVSAPITGIPVKLTVYNLLGKEVAVLVNENKVSGIYDAEFNAANYASGVYIYKLTAGSNSASGKMMLIK